MFCLTSSATTGHHQVYVICPFCLSCLYRSHPHLALPSGSFDVLEEELIPDPVQARLEDSKKVLWFSNVGEEEGMFEIQVDEGGLHRFCLENGKHLESDGYDRRIGFSLRVRSLQEIRSLQDEEGPDEERALQLVEWARDLEDSWANLLDHYEFLKAREDLHKRLTEQTLSRVIRWTFLEGVALTLIALGQVMYLRKFMETRQFL
mmetsp:Transcript_16567/g.38044  ORF Transcript_16567/g.38044 Transcript_16567/m.38044 type:complete len:205 (-) Transcript_16567:538-1152(-)